MSNRDFQNNLESKCEKFAKEITNACFNCPPKEVKPVCTSTCKNSKVEPTPTKCVTPKSQCQRAQPSCLKPNGWEFCPSGRNAPNRGFKVKGLGRKISTNTLHGIESVNDLRSWGICKEDKRKHFLELMNPDSAPEEGQLENEDNGFSDGEQGMEMLETSETTQDSSPIIQDTSSSTPKDKGAEGSLPDEQREGQDDVFPTSTVEVETSESSNQTSVGPVDNSPTEKQLEENAVLDASQKLSSPKTNEANVVIESFIEMPVEIQDEVMEKPQSTSRKSFHDDVHNTPPQNTTSRKSFHDDVHNTPPQNTTSRKSFQDDAHKTPPQNTSRKSFQEDGYNTVSRVASDEKTPAFLNDAPEPTNEENDSDILIYRIDTATDFEIQGDEVSYMGTEIIPSEDSNARFPSNDAQKSRLEGMDTLLQLEALKTQLDQMRQALEVEKQKSQELEKQIDQITPIGPNYPQDTGDRNNIDDQVLGLLDTLRQKQERECQLSRHLQCAVKTITELRDENQQIRNYIAELEQELQYYATQMDKVTNRQ